MTLHNLPGAKPEKTPITTDQMYRAVAFVLVVLPTAVSVNVLIWSLAGLLWRTR